MINKVIVLGGGSAGFMTAMALKAKVRGIEVVVIRAKEIGVIGVGESSTFPLTRYLHQYIGVSLKKFYEIARPTWKLGLKFIWGPRPYFHYPFGPGLESRVDFLRRNIGQYCDEGIEYATPLTAMMTHDKAFERDPKTGGPILHNFIAYHIDNPKYVAFLEQYALAALGVNVMDDTVVEVKQDEKGITGLILKSGKTETADLYVDCSGFRSELLGKALAEPYISFKSSLICDRAVTGAWPRGADEPTKPYTTCETMDCGWCWQIEHEDWVNRGYVYSSDFISDEEAEREFRAKNPKVGPTRIVRFTSGRYRTLWVKNVVAIGNAGGFVEPLESTGLGAIAVESGLLADLLNDTDRQIRPQQVAAFNRATASIWDSFRSFIAIHYKYNTRLSTPFWIHCQEKTDLAGAAELMEFYAENGPSPLWEKLLLGPLDQFGMTGYLALLVGQNVPYRHRYVPEDHELRAWQAHCERNKQRALKAMTVDEALRAVHSPKWEWAAKKGLSPLELSQLR